MSTQKLVWLVVAIVIVGAIAVVLSNRAEAPESPEPVVTTVTFGTHLDAGMPEQDVFVEDEDDPEQVVRIEGEPDGETLAKPVFTAAEEAPHDPFKVGDNPLGPFEKGGELGFTMEEWLAASGGGTYTVTGNQAELDLQFENLMPEGVYTVWCSRITLPPEPAIVDTPCGAADGSENSFTAGEDGTASFNVAMEPLEPSTETEVAVVALAYHSDGNTYGEDPGEFGKNSHVQIFYILPPPESEADNE